MLVPQVFMERDPSPWVEPQQDRRRARLAVPVQTVDVHARLKRFPGKFLLPAGNLEEIIKFENPLRIICHAVVVAGTPRRVKTITEEMVSLHGSSRPANSLRGELRDVGRFAVAAPRLRIWCRRQKRRRRQNG